MATSSPGRGCSRSSGSSSAITSSMTEPPLRFPGPEVLSTAQDFAQDRGGADPAGAAAIATTSAITAATMTAAASAAISRARDGHVVDDGQRLRELTEREATERDPERDAEHDRADGERRGLPRGDRVELATAAPDDPQDREVVTVGVDPCPQRVDEHREQDGEADDERAEEIGPRGIELEQLRRLRVGEPRRRALARVLEPVGVRR